MTLRARFAPLALTVAVVATGVGGCIYSSTEKERVVTAPAPPVVAQAPTTQVVTYPEGRLDALWGWEHRFAALLGVGARGREPAGAAADPEAVTTAQSTRTRRIRTCGTAPR